MFKDIVDDCLQRIQLIISEVSIELAANIAEFSGRNIHEPIIQNHAQREDLMCSILMSLIVWGRGVYAVTTCYASQGNV